MKTLFFIALFTALVGCSTTTPAPVIVEVAPTELPNEIDVTIVEPATPVVVAAPAPTPAPLKPARIDAVSFLDALINSGCVIDKAAYKEVARGGGIVVTCRATETPALNIDDLGEL